MPAGFRIAAVTPDDSPAMWIFEFAVASGRVISDDQVISLRVRHTDDRHCAEQSDYRQNDPDLLHIFLLRFWKCCFSVGAFHQKTTLHDWRWIEDVQPMFSDRLIMPP